MKYEIEVTGDAQKNIRLDGIWAKKIANDKFYFYVQWNGYMDRNRIDGKTCIMKQDGGCKDIELFIHGDDGVEYSCIRISIIAENDEEEKILNDLAFYDNGLCSKDWTSIIVDYQYDDTEQVWKPKR